MSRLKFLTKYAVDGVHYDAGAEIDKGLNDDRWRVRWNAIQHPKATSEHIDKALNDIHSDVRWEAIEHPNVTSEHISKALNDSNEDVRRAAARIKKERKL
jgi:HEAT repeat protein